MPEFEILTEVQASERLNKQKPTGNGKALVMVTNKTEILGVLIYRVLKSGKTSVMMVQAAAHMGHYRAQKKSVGIALVEGLIRRRASQHSGLEVIGLNKMHSRILKYFRGAREKGEGLFFSSSVVSKYLSTARRKKRPTLRALKLKKSKRKKKKKLKAKLKRRRRALKRQLG